MLEKNINLQPQDGTKTPSRAAVDDGNPATFHPHWLVVDDVNIDLFSWGIAAAALALVSFFHQPASIVLPVAGAVLLPMRIFFPRPRNPEGLVLITGASSGIGAELTYIFAERGHDLVLVGRDEDQLRAVQDNVKRKYGRQAYTIATDLSVSGAAQQLYDRVTGEDLVVDVLVNGAGLGGAGHTLDQPVEMTERMTMLNCVAPVQLSQLFGRDMVKRGRGWMLQVSSVGGESLPHHDRRTSVRGH